MPNGSDYYETDSHQIIGRSFSEAVEWARQNPAAFARTYIWWLREDDVEAVIVDRDIKDELEAEDDAALPVELHSNNETEVA